MKAIPVLIRCRQMLRLKVDQIRRAIGTFWSSIATTGNSTSWVMPFQSILRAMKKYGMMVADNGSNWYFSGAPDPRWNDDELSTLKAIKGSNFEVVQMGTIVTQ